MLKPRPSPNFGKFTSTRAAVASSPATFDGSSAGSRRTTFASGDGGVSLATRRPMISLAIDHFLEGLEADALHDVDESLGVAVATLEVALDQPLDRVRNLGARERGAEDLAELGAGAVTVRLSLVPADLDLVPLLAVLVDA